MSTKYIFVTGGVASSLGKGITAASLGRLLKARGSFEKQRSRRLVYAMFSPTSMHRYAAAAS